MATTVDGGRYYRSLGLFPEREAAEGEDPSTIPMREKFEAVDAHGKVIPDAPERPENTPAQLQPGALGGPSSEERMVTMLAEAIRPGSTKKKT